MSFTLLHHTLLDIRKYSDTVSNRLHTKGAKGGKRADVKDTCGVLWHSAFLLSRQDWRAVRLSKPDTFLSHEAAEAYTDELNAEIKDY